MKWIKRLLKDLKKLSMLFKDILQLCSKQLFGGGDAELQLTEADYLTAGIDIVVQPPAKVATFIVTKWW